MWTEIPDIIPVDTDAAKKRVNKILQIPLPTGVVVVAALMLFIYYCCHSKRQERKRKKREKAQAEELGENGEEAMMSGAEAEMHKPELMGCTNRS